MSQNTDEASILLQELWTTKIEKSFPRIVKLSKAKKEFELSVNRNYPKFPEASHSWFVEAYNDIVQVLARISLEDLLLLHFSLLNNVSIMFISEEISVLTTFMYRNFSRKKFLVFVAEASGVRGQYPAHTQRGQR